MRSISESYRKYVRNHACQEGRNFAPVHAIWKCGYLCDPAAREPPIIAAPYGNASIIVACPYSRTMFEGILVLLLSTLYDHPGMSEVNPCGRTHCPESYLCHAEWQSGNPSYVVSWTVVIFCLQFLKTVRKRGVLFQRALDDSASNHYICRIINNL